MTDITFHAVPRVPKIGPAFRSILDKISAALDGFGQSRVHQAVAPQQMRRAQREIKRCNRLLHNHAPAARKASGKR